MCAYCDRSGLIGFTSHEKIPSGMLLIASWPNEKKLRDAIEAGARRGWELDVLLVPGIPEAPHEDAALDALMRFSDQTRRRLNGLPALENA